MLSYQDRLDKYTTYPGNNKGCWGWSGARLSNGYAVLTVKPKTLKAHRMRYEIIKGPIPEGMYVCHTCDNPPCTNPDHLFIGSALDNNRDRSIKGRSVNNFKPQLGEKNGNSKLNSDLVREIRSSKERTGALAKHYGLSRHTITGVRLGKLWKHVT